MKRLMIILVIFALAGCVSVKTVPFETTVRTPKADDFPIEILESREVTRPYKVIGLVQANAGKRHSIGDTLEKLRTAARQMGADALLDLNNELIGVGVPAQGGTIYSGHVRDLWRAKAIIWVTPNKADASDGK